MEPLAALIDAVNRIGARNISALARLTKQPVETVRYRLCKHLREHGLYVKLFPDYHRLGLRSVFADMELTGPAAREPRPFFDKLADTAYLTYFAKELYHQRYLTRFGIPVACEAEIHRFLEELQGTGLLKLSNITPVDWSRRVSFNPSFYSFKKREWSIDWSNLPPAPTIEPMLSMRPPAQVELDRKDLLILKELQLDALEPISTMARKLKISRRVLQYHFQTHVLPLAIHQYVRWVGSASEVSQRVIIDYRLTDLRNSQLEQVRQVFARFPFTEMEAGNEQGLYMAVAIVPEREFARASRFLAGQLDYLDTKLSARLLDMTGSLFYTIPYHLYAEGEGWQFDRDKAMGALLPFLQVAAKNRGRAP